MLIRVMKHEWRSVAADKSLWLISALFVAALAHGVYNGVSHVNFHKDSIQQAREDEQRRLEKVCAQLAEIQNGHKPSDPYADASRPFAVGGFLAYRYAIMPVLPLATLAIGQSDLYPYYRGVTIWSIKRHHWSNRKSFVRNSEIENPTNLLAGRFDVAFVIVYLYPLLILAFSYNIISTEREQGTLALLLSQPLALRTFVMGKVGARAVVMLALAACLSLAGVLLGGAALLSGEILLRLALWALVIVAYGGFWFVLAIAVNALGKSSATNAMILVGIWALLVMAVPLLFNLITTAVHPTPPRTEMTWQARQAWIEAEAAGGKLAARYYQERPELMPEDLSPDVRRYAATSFYAQQEEIDRRIELVLERFDGQALKQRRLIDKLQFLSPAVITQDALSDIAGTGADRFSHFGSLLKDFHKTWRDFFVSKIFRKEPFTMADYGLIPDFNYSEEPASELMRRVLIQLAGLLIPTLSIGLPGILALRRYPITHES